MRNDYRQETVRGLLLTAIERLNALDPCDDASVEGLKLYQSDIEKLRDMAAALTSEDFWNTVASGNVDPIGEMKVNKIVAAIEVLGLTDNDYRWILGDEISG